LAALLDIGAARVFFDGIFTTPRLAHPEGIAIHADGSIWCGSETGDLLRIAADGSSISRMAGTDGFLLGIAFDAVGNCYACDLRHAAVFRYDAVSGRIARFGAAGIRVPNYPVVDARRGALYVSDSRGSGDVGPGIFRFDLRTGDGAIWCTSPMAFANGMALAPGGDGLYVVQSDAACVSYVPIEADGSAGTPRLFVDEVQTVPDGLAFGPDGTLYISCYEPSRIYRCSPGGRLDILIEDIRATVLAHPTNIAVKCDKLYTANLGRWHIAEIDLRAPHAVPAGRPASTLS
jgi:sugar lactone lactonase YvrE